MTPEAITQAVEEKLTRLRSKLSRERYKLSYAVAKEWAVDSLQRRLDALEEAETALAMLGDAYDHIAVDDGTDLDEAVKQEEKAIFAETWKWITAHNAPKAKAGRAVRAFWCTLINE